VQPSISTFSGYYNKINKNTVARLKGKKEKRYPFGKFETIAIQRILFILKR
jgi:hypothetical protein